MKPALVILAAGMGTRFGKGIKQLEPVGPKGELIVDYSIHDALEAGFGKVVFIIRKSMEQDFRERIGKRIEKQAETVYVFQELEDLPEGFLLPEGRIKPWGTGHALLCCREVIHEPFAVINADDYYGKEACHHVRKPFGHGFVGEIFYKDVGVHQNGESRGGDDIELAVCFCLDLYIESDGRHQAGGGQKAYLPVAQAADGGLSPVAGEQVQAQDPLFDKDSAKALGFQGADRAAGRIAGEEEAL
ncbi:uDP-glucose pyrophosphorylase [Clostridium sp. CAG:149]|nr:uDP-glucose pyrophosphorylase [Clostridium sp. CAG:149]